MTTKTNSSAGITVATAINAGGMLLPAVQHVRNHAEGIVVATGIAAGHHMQCANNLRQIGLA